MDDSKIALSFERVWLIFEKIEMENGEFWWKRFSAKDLLAGRQRAALNGSMGIKFSCEMKWLKLLIRIEFVHFLTSKCRTNWFW